MSQGTEQRGHSRVKYPLKLTCIGDYKVFEARANDFSLSGACLFSPVELSAGNTVGIIVKLPGTRGFSVIPAEVVWSKPSDPEIEDCRYLVGIKYLYLLPDLEENFRNLLRVIK
jgi:hypothetical protein